MSRKKKHPPRTWSLTWHLALELEPEIIDYIPSLNTPFEESPLQTLSKEGQLMAYKHQGFWQPMDTLRDKILLNKMWDEGKAPWKIWQ